MKIRGKLAAAAFGALLIVGGIAMALKWMKLRTVMKPEFPTKTLDTVFYTAKYPAHWPDIKAGASPEFDELITFQNHRADELGKSPWDERPVQMMLMNWTHFKKAKSINEIVAAEMKGGFDHSKIETVTLNNGMKTKTWTQKRAYIEIIGESRYYAFQAPNGDFYDAETGIPAEWVVRKRYDHIFRNILGSLEFKTLPADRKEP